MVYFIPTPIGNLQDISLRSIELLSECTTIFCEDTRKTKRLLQLLHEKHGFDFDDKCFISLHVHNEKERLESIDKNIFEKDVAYVSDAGMPCISDPGSALVRYCQVHGIKYDVLPGANAALLAYANSGFDNPRFIFYGFLPHKKQNRNKAWEEILSSTFPVIVYESPHRLDEFMEELFEKAPQIDVCFIKEATKKFSTRFVGKASVVIGDLKKSNLKGEWAIVLNTQNTSCGEHITKDDILQSSMPPKQKAKLLAKLSGKSVKECYENLKSS